MTVPKHQLAREWVDADLSDAFRHVQDATARLKEAGLPASPKLRAELEAARSTIAAAHGTFRSLLQAEVSPPVHVGGNAEDCPACALVPSDQIPYPWHCPGPAPEETDR